MNYLNMVLTPEADALIVHCPKDDIQREAAHQAEYRDGIAETLGQIDAQLSLGKKVYLLDVAYANGGSLELIDVLKQKGLIDRLSGYSAWNTATNALGTILSQMVIESETGTSHSGFKWARVLDDGLYLSCIRQLAAERLGQMGEDSLNLKDKAAAESLVRKLFQEKLTAESWPVSVKGQCKTDQDLACEISLPWNRLFEARINVN